jgi:hypothetical protein
MSKSNLKLSPQNIELEETLLASVFVDEKVFEKIENVLSPDDFYKHSNKILYESFKAIKADGKKIDVVTVCDQLEQSGNLQKAGGKSGLAKIMDQAPISLNPEGHSGIIKKCSLKRQILTLGQKLSDGSLNGKSIDDLLKIAKDELEIIKTPFASKSKFKLKRLSEIEAKAPDSLINQLLEKDTLNMVFGDPGAAKTFFAIDMASCVATGKDFHGMGAKQGPVVYIAGEGQNGIKRRFAAWEIRYGYNLDDTPIFVSLMPAGLCDQDQARWVIDEIKLLQKECGEPALIIFDTLARNFGPGDENSTKDMSAFILGADQIREQSKACILLVHHTGHGDKSRGRGAMALKGALDAEYRLEKDDQGTVRVSCTKMKDFKPPAPMAFKIRTVELGINDEDGKEVTSAVLDSIDFEAPTKPSNTGRGKWQAIAINAYQDLEIEHKERLEQKGYDPGAARVLVTDWRNKCSDLKMSKQTFANCKKSLLEQGIFKIEHGYIMRSI